MGGGVRHGRPDPGLLVPNASRQEAEANYCDFDSFCCLKLPECVDMSLRRSALARALAFQDRPGETRN